MIREPEHEKRNFVFSRQEMFLARRKKTSNNSPFSFTLEKIATASHCLSFFVAAKNESRASRQRPRRRRENSLLSPLSGLGIGGLQKKGLTGGLGLGLEPRPERRIRGKGAVEIKKKFIMFERKSLQRRVENNRVRFCFVGDLFSSAEGNWKRSEELENEGIDPHLTFL